MIVMPYENQKIHWVRKLFMMFWMKDKILLTSATAWHQTVDCMHG